MAEKTNDGGPARPRIDPMDWFRAQYGVPAKKGGRVEYTGDRQSGAKLGTITGTQGPHLLVRLDGEKHSNPYHPTWELRYLDASPSPADAEPGIKAMDEEDAKDLREGVVSAARQAIIDAAHRSGSHSRTALFNVESHVTNAINAAFRSALVPTTSPAKEGE